MTDRLTPVGSSGGAEAVLAEMVVEVVVDNVIGDVAGRGGEVAPLPEALAPVAFADVLELLLYLAGGASLGPADEVADRDVRRDFDEQVDMVARQGAVDNGDAHLSTDLPNDLAHPEPHLAVQHLEPVLR